MRRASFSTTFRLTTRLTGIRTHVLVSLHSQPHDNNRQQYWRDLYPSVTMEDLDEHKQKYRFSDEEKEDLRNAYVSSNGNMASIFEAIPFSNMLEDEERFRKHIWELIEAGEVKKYRAFANESPSNQTKRMKKAKREATEAAQAAKSIKAKRATQGQHDLGSILAKRSKHRAAQFDSFVAKYTNGQDMADEPDEEAFQQAAARVQQRARPSASATKRQSSRKAKN